MEPTLELLSGMTISHVWLGHGTALFLELGKLSESRVTKAGHTGNPQGEVTVIIDYDWRVERQASIYFGSNNTKKHLRSATKKLLGANVLSAHIVGRLPELQIQLSNSLWLTTFSHDKGQPTWAVGFKTPNLGWLCVRRGKVVIDRRNS